MKEVEKYRNVKGILILVVVVFLFAIVAGEGSVEFSIAEDLFRGNITLVANEFQSIDTTTNSNIIFLVSSNVTGSLEVTEYTGNIEDNEVGFADVGLRFFVINASQDILDVLSVASIVINYTDEEVLAVGLNESGLNIYFFNDTLNKWQLEVNSFVDTVANFVLANVTHFSTFGVGGNIPSEVEDNLTGIVDGGGSPTGSTVSCYDGYEYVADTGCVLIEDNVTEVEIKLFDITFNLEDTVIARADDLASIVTFENFGNVLTDVNLTFIVLDADGNEVYRGETLITVMTEEVLIWSYGGIDDFVDGKYVAILETFYNEDTLVRAQEPFQGVYDEFRVEFEINKVKASLLEFVSMEGNLWIWVGIVIMIIVLFGVLNWRKWGR